jgi:predicted acylesterase/phospholipase RssA
VEGTRLGVAVSGGGYRATAWALGVLLGLAESGAKDRVSTISSVSGGSITNAAVAMSKMGYSTADSTEFARFAAELANRLAGRPRWFHSVLALEVALIVSMWIVVRWASWGLPVALGILMILAAYAGSWSGDMLFGRIRMWLYIDVVFGGGVAAIVLAWGHWWWFAAAVVGLSLVLQVRGMVVGSAIGASLRKLTRHSGKLADLNKDVVHVICATELRAGHHMYFSPGFVAAFDFGLGLDPDLPIHAAVQASANLPGAFPTRWMRSGPLGFRVGPKPPFLLALTDGGVYDNMGDQWLSGLPGRIKRLKGELAASRLANDEVEDVARLWESINPDVVIVGNASGALQPRKVWSALLPWIGEITGLLQVKDVLYDNGNSVRRSYLVYRFDRKDPLGTLVHIASSPYWFPDSQAMQGGATKAIRWLDTLGMTRDQWEKEPNFSRSIGTTFWPLGIDRTNRLINHAYAETIANLLTREIVEAPPTKTGLPRLLRSDQSA